MAFLQHTLILYLEAAPWLLFGLLAAGALKALVPEERIGRWLGGGGAAPVVKAAVIGAPLPLCSCGVLPAALGLRRGGAGRGPTVAFLVATPETGVDSIALSYALLGPFMALVRPLAAVLSAVFAGLLATLAERTMPPEAPRRGPVIPLMVANDRCDGAGCGCSHDAATATTGRSTAGRLAGGARYALSDILDDISLWLALGLLAAGAVATWLPPLALAELGSGPLAMGAMLLVGVPMYICATASTPLAAALLLAGMSPGTVLVFLLAGPATNLATLAVVGRELGRPVLVAYLVGIVVASVGLGMATDALVAAWPVDIAAQLADGAHGWLPAWVEWGSGGLLALCAVPPLRRRLPGFGTWT
ncbi:SO_0444 family Cu/Zn efflux transporter [Endothiovibrio diazotrophicus]